MAFLFKRTAGLTGKPTHYCPGCSHGIVHRLVAESLEELGLLGRTVGVASVGCSVFSYEYFNCDMHQAPHGRAPAVATGIKRVLPHNTVFTYQGDGDLASIGTAEIVHAAHRGEKITTIFINNANYGMTGGQMAPTTLPHQKTTTCPLGRDPKSTGMPLRVSEMISTIDGAVFVERVSVDSPSAVRNAKSAILKAFRCQIEGKGFSMVEVLSSCPTNLNLKPSEAMRWVRENMVPYYPLGNFRSPKGGK